MAPVETPESTSVFLHDEHADPLARDSKVRLAPPTASRRLAKRRYSFLLQRIRGSLYSDTISVKTGSPGARSMPM